MMGSELAVHRTIIAVDVEGFGDPARTLRHQLGTRAGLYRAVQEAFEAAEVPWEACRVEDRGDAVFCLVPPDIPKGPLVEVLPAALVRAVRAHNSISHTKQRLRLRTAVHAGEVASDEHGVTSTAVTTTFRLLDAPPFKQALRDSSGVVAMIVSGWVFDEVVRHSTVLDPSTFRPIPVAVKETRANAWIALPDQPYPADPTILDEVFEKIAATRRATTLSDVAGTAHLHSASTHVVPRQLPAPPAGFIGRAEQLTRLDHALTAATTCTEGPSAMRIGSMAGTGAAVFISALGGAGGIGKTWLALHWAHRNTHRFPDGQLFVDLRGFSPDCNPLDPLTAIRNFLVALGVAPGGIPTDLAAQTALYRSKLADKRMLIVLDNAVTTDQVEPLLPGTATCTVLVTSRKKLATLITRYDARHLQLDALTYSEAHALLIQRLSQPRVAQDPQAANELIRLCGCYPLALAIMARHAHARPSIPLAEFSTELRELGLDALDHDDLTASLPAVLSWSMRGLTVEQRAVFALLGIAPGPDIGLLAAASLTGLPPRRTSKTMQTLEDASLLVRHPGNRYAMHDLIRDYAASTATRCLAGKTLEVALRRVLDFYTHTAHAAQNLLDPHRQRVRLNPPTPGTHSYLPPDHTAAMAWFDIEHVNVRAAQHTAICHGWHRVICLLAWALDTFHQRRARSYEQIAVWQAALDAATHLTDPVTQIRAHRLMGQACAALGRHNEALSHLHQALTMAKHHHPAVLAHTHRTLAYAWGQRGNDQQALDHATHALHLLDPLNQPVWKAVALNVAGFHTARLGDYNSARTHCQAALALHRHHHNPNGESATLDSLGYIAHHTGHHHHAIRYYHQALALYDDLGNAYRVADTLDRLGHPYTTLGHHNHARTAWTKAMQLYQEQGRSHDAQRVQQQLDTLDYLNDHSEVPSRSWRHGL